MLTCYLVDFVENKSGMLLANQHVTIILYKGPICKLYECI